MKKLFTKEELENKARLDVDTLFPNKESISIQEILSQDLSLEYKRWFIFTHCELSEEEETALVVKMMEEILPLYEDKFPILRDCVEDIKNGDIFSQSFRKILDLEKEYIENDPYCNFLVLTSFTSFICSISGCAKHLVMVARFNDFKSFSDIFINFFNE